VIIKLRHGRLGQFSHKLGFPFATRTIFTVLGSDLESWRMTDLTRRHDLSGAD